MTRPEKIQDMHNVLQQTLFEFLIFSSVTKSAFCYKVLDWTSERLRMDECVEEFFSIYSPSSTKGRFHKVIALHDSPELDWGAVSSWAPLMCRGWLELCRLPSKTRIQFSYEYWLSKISYHPGFDIKLSRFFERLQDIGVFLTQKAFDAPFEVHMVYELSGKRGFYRGMLPAKEGEIAWLQREFPSAIFPADYLSFLAIHSGFSKTTDCSGIIPAQQIAGKYAEFQQLLQNKGVVTTEAGDPINPKSLIPFYESFGMPFYQCFWNEWHPGDGMGNVYYSGSTGRISCNSEKTAGSEEAMAFQTFSDWLLFYLEQIEF